MLKYFAFYLNAAFFPHKSENEEEPEEGDEEVGPLRVFYSAANLKKQRWLKPLHLQTFHLWSSSLGASHFALFSHSFHYLFQDLFLYNREVTAKKQQVFSKILHLKLIQLKLS